MSAAPGVASPQLDCILAFDGNNRLAVRRLGSKAGLAFSGSDLPMATARLESAFGSHTPPLERLEAEAGGRSYRVFLSQVEGPPADAEIEFRSVEQLEGAPGGSPRPLPACCPASAPT